MLLLSREIILLKSGLLVLWLFLVLGRIIKRMPFSLMIILAEFWLEFFVKFFGNVSLPVRLLFLLLALLLVITTVLFLSVVAPILSFSSPVLLEIIILSFALILARISLLRCFNFTFLSSHSVI